MMLAGSSKIERKEIVTIMMIIKLGDIKLSVYNARNADLTFTGKFSHGDVIYSFLASFQPLVISSLSLFILLISQPQCSCICIQ